MAAYSQSALIDAYIRCDYLTFVGKLLLYKFIDAGTPGWNGGPEGMSLLIRDILDDRMTSKQRALMRDAVRELNAYCRRKALPQFNPTNGMLDDIIKNIGDGTLQRSELRRELVR